MNKPIKAKNLPLFSIIDLDQLRRENHLEDAVLSDFLHGLGSEDLFVIQADGRIPR